MRQALLPVAAFFAPLLARAQPVIIQHDPVTQAAPGVNVALRARIRAAAGVFEPTAYWRPAGTKQFKGLPMAEAGGEDFTAVIPAQMVKDDLEYYLEAYDKNLEGPARSGSASRPHRIRVMKAVAAGTLQIQSEPAGADVLIDGRAAGLTPYRAELQPGKHRLRLQLKDYQAHETEIEMPEGRDHALSVRLQRAVERLQLIVRSDPPGAVVELDGLAMGTTPYFGPAVPGRRQLVVRKAGHGKAARNVEIARDTHYDLGVIALAPEARPELKVESDPPGADLFLDGAAVGATPYRGSAAPGDHELLLRKAGYADTAVSIALPDRGFSVRVPLATREQGPRFAVSSDPPGARVSIDGAFVGATPWTGEARAGERTVALELAGRVPARRAVKVAPGLHREVALALAEAPPPAGATTLTVNTSPQGAQILLDGRTLEKSPWTGEVEPGAHVVQASLEGFRRVEQRFTAAAGQPLGLALALSEPPASGEQPLLTVTTQPPGAELSIDGAKVGETPWSGMLGAGEHALELKREGRLSLREAAVLPPDRAFELRLQFALAPELGPASPQPPPLPAAPVSALPVPGAAAAAPGTLFLASQPPGARVLLDGAQVGQTPFRGAVSAGEHLVLLQRPLHRETAVFIDMPAGRDLDLAFDLQPTSQLMRQPIISVISEPPGARVELDGLEIGATPREIEVASGDHTVKVSKEGHVPAAREVVAEGGRRSEVVAVLPALAVHSPEPVAVKVDTEPQGAELILDNAPAGASPADLSVRPGEHWLVARHPEHAELRLLFGVAPLQPRHLTLPLPPRGRTDSLLVVESDPPGAAVLVDGDRLGTTPARIPAPAGPHRFALQLEGRVGVEERVDLAPTHEVRVDAVLPPLEPAARPRGGPRAAPRDKGFSLERSAGPIASMALGGLLTLIGGAASAAALSHTRDNIGKNEFTYADYERDRRVSLLGDTAAVAGLILVGAGAWFMFEK